MSDVTAEIEARAKEMFEEQHPAPNTWSQIENKAPWHEKARIDLGYAEMPKAQPAAEEQPTPPAPPPAEEQQPPSAIPQE